VSKFRKLALDSIEYALSALASEGVYYPKVVVFGGAVFALALEKVGEAIYQTRDIDLLLESPADLDEINLAFLRFRRAHPDEVEVVIKFEARMLVPLRKELFPVEFVRPSKPRVQDLFRYTYHNAREELGKLEIRSKPVVVHLAKLEDSILCKLAAGRKKDTDQLRRILPKLNVDQNYLRETAKRFGVSLLPVSRTKL